MYLLTKQALIDPHDVPLNSLVAQERVDVNFISRSNFNNNAYRSSFGRNPRPFPSNNYGNNNTFPSTKNSTPRDRDFPSYEKLLEKKKATKNYMHTQYEQNKTFFRQLHEHSSILQNIGRQLESLNIEISNLQTRLTTMETQISNMSHTQATLINQMEAKPEVVSSIEEEDRIKSLPTHTTISTIQVVEDLKTFSTQHTPSAIGPINGDANTSTLRQEGPINLETTKKMSLDDITTTLINGSDLDF